MADRREKKDNSGALFVNDRKEKDEHPDRSGSATIDGVDYWVSGWINEIKSGDKKGDKYMALKFNRKDEKSGGRGGRDGGGSARRSREFD
jgi:hypothetical protein